MGTWAPAHPGHPGPRPHSLHEHLDLVLQVLGQLWASAARGRAQEAQTVDGAELPLHLPAQLEQPGPGEERVTAGRALGAGTAPVGATGPCTGRHSGDSTASCTGTPALMTDAADGARLTLMTPEVASFPVSPNMVLHARGRSSWNRVQRHGLFPHKWGSDGCEAALKQS